MSAENTKIIDRIRKLLKLAQDAGATEGERDNALRMAHATLAKYNIDMTDVDMEASVEKRVEIYFDELKQPFAKIICNSIAKLFFCKAYFVSCPMDIPRAGIKCRYFFVGLESNTLTAMLMSQWVLKSLLTECRKRKATTDFLNGASHKIAARVRDIIESSATNSEFSTSTALAVVSLYKTEQQANDEFLSDRTMKEGKFKKTKMDRDQYLAGSAYGDTINLNKQAALTN